ncbi:Lcl domain-containing protein [Pseudomonas abietaniphila]|jgi:hypothetical protein
MSTIFISYRRDDSEGQAGRLFDDLVEHFGKDSVFIDVAGIDKGRDFRKIIERYISSCSVVLVVMGKNWLESKDEHGRRRIDKEDDYVRYETSVALTRDIPVIPVLISNTSMPRPDQLPPSISELAFRNGVELGHTRWASDVKVLISHLSPYVNIQLPSKPPEEPPNKWRKLTFLSAAGIAGVFALYSIFYFWPWPVVPVVTASRPANIQGGVADAQSESGPAGKSPDVVNNEPAAEQRNATQAPSSSQATTVSSNAPTKFGTATISDKPKSGLNANPGGIYKDACGAITDESSKLQWVVGPDQDTTWQDAKSWVESLSLCGGSWRLPTTNDLKSLYDPSKSAGTGFFAAEKYWPARIDPLFNGIGDGSWIWANEAVDSNNAKAVNMNQGVPVTLVKSQTQYPVRVFAVRQLKGAPK